MIMNHASCGCALYSLLCFSFGFYLRFVLVSKNVDVVIQNMTFRPMGFAAVKPTNYIVCMSDCAYVSACAHSLNHSCKIALDLLYLHKRNSFSFSEGSCSTCWLDISGTLVCWWVARSSLSSRIMNEILKTNNDQGHLISTQVCS